MIRTILVAAAALASVSSPGHAESAQAPWCAVIELDPSTVITREAIFWQAIEAFVIRARTTPLDPRSKGRSGNVTLARIKTGVPCRHYTLRRRNHLC